MLPPSLKQQTKNNVLFQPLSSPVALLQSTSGSIESSPSSKTEFDSGAVLRYFIATAVELACFGASFRALDLLISKLSLTNSIPSPIIGFLFYFISLKSRIFNPLNNQRPNRDKSIQKGGGEASPGFRDRVMPSWTPPGFIFPIMWLLIIGPIRAVSSTMIVNANQGVFCTKATMSLILHLTLGDVWNTVNNTEKRYGPSVVGVLAVVASIFYAAKQYYLVSQPAGKLLGATALWLVTASALITDTWRLNPDADGNRDTLYPTKKLGEKSITKISWFS